MFRLRPTTEDDILKVMAKPPFDRFPQDESELAALFNRILEEKIIEGITSRRPPLLER